MTFEEYQADAKRRLLKDLLSEGSKVRGTPLGGLLQFAALHIEGLHNSESARDQEIGDLRAEVERLGKDSERYQWLKSAKGLTLESERGSPWTREDGSKFRPSHRLCAGGTQFAPCETLDDAIDEAMKEQK